MTIVLTVFLFSYARPELQQTEPPLQLFKINCYILLKTMTSVLCCFFVCFQNISIAFGLDSSNDLILKVDICPHIRGAGIFLNKGIRLGL